MSMPVPCNDCFPGALKWISRYRLLISPLANYIMYRHTLFFFEMDAPESTNKRKLSRWPNIAAM